MSPLVISSIVLPGSTNAVDYEFGEFGLTPPFVSKRLLLYPAQPVVLTAVYSTRPRLRRPPIRFGNDSGQSRHADRDKSSGAAQRNLPPSRR